MGDWRSVWNWWVIKLFESQSAKNHHAEVIIAVAPRRCWPPATRSGVFNFNIQWRILSRLIKRNRNLYPIYQPGRPGTRTTDTPSSAKRRLLLLSSWGVGRQTATTNFKLLSCSSPLSFKAVLITLTAQSTRVSLSIKISPGPAVLLLPLILLCWRGANKHLF